MEIYRQSHPDGELVTATMDSDSVTIETIDKDDIDFVILPFEDWDAIVFNYLTIIKEATK